MVGRPKLRQLAVVFFLPPASYSVMLALLLAVMQASPPKPDSAAVRREARELQYQFELFRREHLPISEVGKDKCEVKIGRFCYWYDPADPPLPEEPKEIADARADFLAQLENLANYSPTDPWILAQRVRYTVEQGLFDSAAAIASCSTWWCSALSAYAHYYKGEVGIADSLYTKAMAQAPMGVRCDWNHLGQALEPQEKGGLRPPRLSPARFRGRIPVLARQAGIFPPGQRRPRPVVRADDRDPRVRRGDHASRHGGLTGLLRDAVPLRDGDFVRATSAQRGL
jgi:hypothetical protein